MYIIKVVWGHLQQVAATVQRWCLSCSGYQPGENMWQTEIFRRKTEAQQVQGKKKQIRKVVGSNFGAENIFYYIERSVASI